MEIHKKKALDEFVVELKRRLGNKVMAAYLFGSTAKGVATSGSDIDVLVIYSGVNKREVEDVVDELTFNIACETEESIEAILMSEKEYKAGIGRSPFLWEVLQFGKAIFAPHSFTEWRLDFEGYLKLAREYLDYAKDAMKENRVRLAIDTAYNAAELLAKALIISTRNSLASSHGGIVGQFGKLFVLSGRVDPQMGKGLNKSLRLRGQARYEPGTELKREDAEFVIDLSEKLLKFAQEHLETKE